MKDKIEREVRRRGLVDNIKLGAGGIREIEFIVQVFQLIREVEAHLQQHELLKILLALTAVRVANNRTMRRFKTILFIFTKNGKYITGTYDQQTQV